MSFIDRLFGNSLDPMPQSAAVSPAARSPSAGSTSAPASTPASPSDSVAVEQSNETWGGTPLWIGDPANALPERARAKLISLRDEADAASYLKRGVENRVDEAADDRRRWNSRISTLREPRYGPVGKPVPEFDPAMVDAKRKLEAATEKLNRLNDQLSTYARRSAALGELLRTVDGYLHGAGRLSELAVLPEAKPRKGETVHDAIERCQRRLRELEADEHRVRSAPMPSSVAKALARTEIERLAKEARPSVHPLLEARGPDNIPSIKWRGQSDTNVTLGGRVFVCRSIATPWTALPWLFRDALIAAVEAEIDEQSDDATALTDEQRAEQLATIARDRLAVEREEVTLIDLGRSQGGDVLYRAKTDPRALLGLGDDAPAPEWLS